MQPGRADTGDESIPEFSFYRVNFEARSPSMCMRLVGYAFNLPRWRTHAFPTSTKTYQGQKRIQSDVTYQGYRSHSEAGCPNHYPTKIPSMFIGSMQCCLLLM